MDDDIFIPEEPELPYYETIGIGPTIMKVVSKYIWGIDYVPLDNHDLFAIYILLLTMTIFSLTICVIGYHIIELRKESVKQRQRVKAAIVLSKQYIDKKKRG